MNDRKPIFEPISTWSTQRPAKRAVVFGEQTLSYAQLEYQSNLLARYLLSKYPMHPRGRIAVYLEPGLMMPVVLLAILKAGYTYIPLSDFLPNERVLKILDDAAAFLLLTTVSIMRKTGIGKNFPSTLALEDIAYADMPATISLPVVQKTDIAYVLYTSGSTGLPKGVVIEHGNLSYYLDWFNQALWPETQAVLPLTSTLSFAAAVTQLYAPLLRGDTLHILPANILHEPEKLLTWYEQHPSGALYCVPTVWDALLRYDRQAGGASRLPTTVFLSGEPVPFDLKERTFAQCPDATVYNLYGPTETTANGSFARLEKGKAVTLGKALRGSKILIVDDDCSPVSGDRCGEICIVGEGVARGYLNRDTLTHQRFFTQEIDHACYRGHRTGDLGKFNSHGEIVYLGRIDRQIKINGVRIDPEEIEIALREDHRIRHALVRKTEESTGGIRLIAYLVPESEGTISANEIRNFLRLTLPAAMIPSHFIFVETMPKLPNGKLDLQRLPQPVPSRPALSYAFRPAANELEQELIDIFQEALGFCDLGADDNFFDLGGGSLQVIQIRQLIKRRLFSDIDYTLFFDNATPHLLSFIVPYYVNDTDPVVLENDFRLPSISSEQRYFLTLDQISPAPGAYQIAFRLAFGGPLDISAMEWSIQQILKNNPVLRSRFNLNNVSCSEGDYPASDLKIVRQECAAEICTFDELSDEGLLAAAGVPEMDLELMPLIHIRFMSLPASWHILLLQVHHTVFDHDSIGLFFKQFIAYFQAYRAGDRGFELGQGKGYQHYRCWQQQCIQPTRYPQEREFWLETFAHYVHTGADASLFSPRDTLEGKNVWFTISKALTQSLMAFARSHQTTVFVCMLTAFNVLLNTFTRYRHVPIGIPVSNRMLYEETSLLGCFVNRVTYYDKYSPEDDIGSLLDRCRKRVYGLLENQTIPYDILNSDIRAHGWMDLLYAPVCFNYLSAMPSPVNCGGVDIDVKAVESDFAKVDMTLSIHEGECLNVCFNYHMAALKKDEVIRLSKEYIGIIERMTL
ncbi:TPA: AMP-binding protein [Serratia marcescens]|uniref:AMP-binding protein n=1 Tax=Serratia marcescens TaxID=615 RepID=UPI0013D985BA|nr:AMP-binding protein [Serratia marcescens]MBH2836207.1 AMP-binding protein [Serratia marcescens]MDU7466294.1 AMP-binding protein [Serratia marcescens]WAZ02718.1 AMP-binding protein [Serratia marcescens]HEJ7093881.1 AMP-binding protein [Serratia marcescens]